VREETRIAVEACVAALNTEWTPEERERHSYPPYPFPDRLISHRDAVFAEVERLRQDGATDCSAVLTTRELWSAPWGNIADRLPKQHGSDVFTAGLTLLAAGGAMSASELQGVIPQVPDHIIRNKLRSQLIHMLLTAGEVESAEQVAETLEPFAGRDQRFLGHRRVALWHAQRGDATAFFAAWPRLAASEDRHHMSELKQTLIHSVGRVHGWRHAITAASDRRIGPKFRIYAFTALAEAGDVEGLLELFAENKGEGLLDELDELTVLAKATATKATRTGVATPEPAIGILHRIIAVEPSNKEAVRRRDAMTLTLWPAYPDGDALALARKSVRTPSIRRELTELHPDVDRPGAG
jgi:hypothetical protein